VWLSQLEHLENEYVVAKTHIVGHNVCDNVVDLPDVLEIPGVEGLKPLCHVVKWCLVCMTPAISHGLLWHFFFQSVIL
jgi:hypothetical protein